ncbi:thioesterase family protein [Nonomuraea cavernae]|uniref:Fluoroacetyl-CoA-specific thioesterase-like domain-containing protein n=1 Tax=Nonomuraea cavernae TaxID=2045107 RepID=A0A918DGX2_9ACTN|nr:hotdog domain-containing protein [Nonomuraea cavernae]MCA2184807.1 thioesterase [Nonomuraea cavernae]GGO64520.1 hypothetical protein GCM10012289_14040 [Nonomuraea cavernae]
MNLAPGLRSQLLIVVKSEDTAREVGSGDVPVLATPRLLAIAEMATVQALRPHLAPGETSVGNRAELQHLAPSPIGTHVEFTTELTESDGKRLVFTFEARDRRRVVGRGTIERVVVDRAAFIERATR